MSDYWRADSVDKAVCNQTHDYAKFGTGMFYRITFYRFKKFEKIEYFIIQFLFFGAQLFVDIFVYSG